ncbi:MAG: DUF2779 domain-containing protein [Thermoleophilia bacterium]|nr:DUF2779 domain-containing protein [Thermoleophilia bacterium]
MARVPRLSKSRFQAGLQCPKRLWLACHHPELADPVGEAKQAVFDLGHRVGELARARFPGGVLVAEDYRQTQAALRTTVRLIEEGAACLYEPAFEHDGVLVRVDVLRKADGEGWELIEVKSSTQAKREHVTDAAVQTYVLRGAGLPIARTLLMHLNNQYLYRGGFYDLQELFTLENLTAQVEEYLPAIPELVVEMKAMLMDGCPETLIGRRCREPYDCEFMGHCRSFLPDFPVTDLPRLSDDLLAEFLGRGIFSTREVPLQHPDLTAYQRTVCEVAQSGEPRFGEGLAVELAALAYPLHFLDFETIMPALPVYEGTRPYQTIPIQWSCHTLHQDGALEHREFLHRERTDPRPELTERLLAALAGPGTVVSYTGYEQMVLKGLAQNLPHLAGDIAGVESRLFDLHKAVREYVCHPEFHGRTSLKSVLPALVPDLSYQGLAIPNGEVATLRYQEAVWNNMPESKRDTVFNDLLQYCAVDTLAMVRVFEELRLHG